MTNRQLIFSRKTTPSVKTALFITFFLFSYTLIGFSQTIRYVSEGSSGGGSSWQNASGDLQAMIDASDSGDQIWVSGGTYYPDETAGQVNNNRLASFVMKEGVKIYGSFVGNETSLSQRDAFLLFNSPSILSGDIDKNELSTNNSYHVILNNQNGLTAAAVLDGFTIKGGNANVYSSPTDFFGGGIYNRSVSPTIRNCIFTGNSASVGGAMYNLNASPKITNCQFFNNAATNSDGAGMYNQSGTPSVTNCVFYGNNPGGMCNNNAPVIITNCTFSSNTTYGISNATSNVILRNSLIWGNETEIINNSSTPTYTKTLIRNLQVGGFNGTDEPYFWDELNGNFRLRPCSPYINQGDNTLNTETTDLDGNARIQLSTIDLGAYEAESTNQSSITLGTISAICVGATSFTIPYTATTGSPTHYRIFGTGITAVANGVLANNQITVNLSTPASGSAIAFTLTVINATGCVSRAINGSVTVNPLPNTGIFGINATYSKCDATVFLTGKGTPLGGTFKIDGITTLTLDPSVLSIGAHTLTYSFSNANGCTNTATQNVTIAADTIKPIITCPNYMGIHATGRNNIGGGTIWHECGAPAIFTVTATDNCSATITQTAGYASGLHFPMGETVNTFVATDPSGNTSTCSFSVYVLDDTPPTFTSCPPSVTINADPTPNGSCGARHFYTLPTATDICFADILLITPLGNGSLFPVGTTTVVYRAIDYSRNTRDCGLTVTVVDNTPPQITCPPSRTVNADAGASSIIVNYPRVTAADNCMTSESALASVTQTSGLISGSAFPIGTTTNVFTAKDSYNNISTCNFSVTVVGDVTTQVAAAALHFDGVNDYVSTTNALTAPTTFSIEAWFKTYNTGGGAILGFCADPTGLRSDMYSDRSISLTNSGQVVFTMGRDGGTSRINYAISPSFYNDGNFHHVAATYSSATGMNLYMDGQLVGSYSAAFTPFNYIGYWRIGSHLNTFGAALFKGTLDEVRIWNRVLSATEIQNNMNCELPNTGTTGLLNYYKFNKGINNADNTSLTTGLPDASGFANNGLLNGFTLTGVVSNWKFPGAIATGTTCNLVLPVELLSFSGKNTEGGNWLSWATAEEKNARDFDIERSRDGQFFTKIGTVKANGSNSNYTFLDDKPVSNLHYYQLKIHDLDGKITHSKIISIQSKGKSTVKIYPSVTTGHLTIENVLSFQIINTVGQVVVSEKGLENFQSFLNLSLSHLPNGIYIIKGVDTEGGYFSEKVVKQ